MAILTAPILEAQLPAFYGDQQLAVPFQYPAAVGPNDIARIVMTIKEINSGAIIMADAIAAKQENNIVYFPISKELIIGQFYKVQIAFVDKDTGKTGILSEAAVVKYTAEPQITINNLDSSTDIYNSHQREYTGQYVNDGDPTEKVISYCFNIYDEFNNLVETSGEQIHSIYTDSSNSTSTDSWKPKVKLESYYPHKIEYIVTTKNKLTASAVQYQIIDAGSIDSDINADLEVGYCIDDACFKIGLKRQLGLPPSSGTYALFRSSSEDNWASLHEICRFPLDWTIEGDNLTKFICYDRAIKHGYKYQYSIAQYNKHGVYSNLITTSKNIEAVEFEDMYLSDADRSLRIRFNPKVTSFKNTLLETKADTIGGTYPIFYRNGHTKYKEFPISGLISILMDEHETFTQDLLNDHGLRRISTAADPQVEAERQSYRTARTQLAAANIDTEREFKLQVLEWLTNGKPKLFRSPTEGNYIVRLMNVSLTPNDTLGRMIHTFNATAYEIEEYNVDNLQKLHFICPQELDLREERVKVHNLFGTKAIKEDNINLKSLEIISYPNMQFLLNGNIQFTSSLGQYNTKFNTNLTSYQLQPVSSPWANGTTASVLYYSIPFSDFDSNTNIYYRKIILPHIVPNETDTSLIQIQYLIVQNNQGETKQCIVEGKTYTILPGQSKMFSNIDTNVVADNDLRIEAHYLKRIIEREEV